MPSCKKPPSRDLCIDVSSPHPGFTREKAVSPELQTEQDEKMAEIFADLRITTWQEAGEDRAAHVRKHCFYSRGTFRGYGR